MDTYLAVVQTLAVAVAVGGLIVALRIAARDRTTAEALARADRKSAAEIARQDRSLARWEEERRHRLDLLVRLSQNLERGGSTDDLERNRLGAESAALISALGPDVLPGLFERRGEIDDARQRVAEVDTADWDWRHRADAVAVALYDVSTEQPPTIGPAAPGLD